VAFHGANWIEDKNRWSIVKPPEWALLALWNFDDQLVLLPSRKKKQYLLARRRHLSAGLGDVAMLDNKHPDTNMCYVHGLVPIAPLTFRKGKAVWTQQSVTNFLDELRSRDTWAYSDGDPDKHSRVSDAIEEFEKLQEEKAHRTLWENFYHMGRDAWRSMAARTKRRNKRASDYHGVARSQPRTGTAATVSK
jgi:hypothetical protein